MGEKCGEVLYIDEFQPGCSYPVMCEKPAVAILLLQNGFQARVCDEHFAKRCYPSPEQHEASVATLKQQLEQRLDTTGKVLLTTAEFDAAIDEAVRQELAKRLPDDEWFVRYFDEHEQYVDSRAAVVAQRRRGAQELRRALNDLLFHKKSGQIDAKGD